MTAEAIESQQKTEADAQPNSITRIAVAGFKSIAEEREIEIRPLTILAGANSSGKSSIMQPLLLLKQTYESPFDPGALLINGDIIRFTQFSQFFSSMSKDTDNTLSIAINSKDEYAKTIVKQNGQLEVISSLYIREGKTIELFMENVGKATSLNIKDFSILEYALDLFKLKDTTVVTVRARAFLDLSLVMSNGTPLLSGVTASAFANKAISNTIYTPGLRGFPERVYPVTSVGETFPGQFQNYTASVILKWQQEQSPNLEKLAEQLAKLKLAETVQARQINDAQIEILVNRRGNGRSKKPDMVSIADVGVGVSQTLPVLVALLVAKPGQLVYIEQPEIHLHPRAQVALAEILADAARRGVKVVIETHSDLLLLSIQTLVAEGKLPPELVKLHWFELNKKGITEITSRDLDFAGRFGDWPEDFAEVKIQADSAYLDAAEASLRAANRAAKKS
jgi:predicted ATPase